MLIYGEINMINSYCISVWLHEQRQKIKASHFYEILKSFLTCFEGHLK